MDEASLGGVAAQQRRGLIEVLHRRGSRLSWGRYGESITRFANVGQGVPKVARVSTNCGQRSLLIYVPDRGHRYLQFGLIMAEMVTVIAVLMIHRANREPPSKALLLQASAPNLTVLLAVLCGATLVADAMRVARDRSVAGRPPLGKPLQNGELKTPTRRRRRLAAGWLPRPDAAEALGCDPCDVSGRGIGHPREDDVGPEIGVGEALEDLGGTTLGHARDAIQDKIFEQSPLVRGG